MKKIKCKNNFGCEVRKNNSMSCLLKHDYLSRSNSIVSSLVQDQPWPFFKKKETHNSLHLWDERYGEPVWVRAWIGISICIGGASLK